MAQPQQHQMNIGMAGGPVGGGGQQVNAGTPSSGDGITGPNAVKRLNTAIYDYLLRNGLYDVARGFVKHVEIEAGVKKSPNQRGQPNGVADDGMDVEVPEIKNRPEDLPPPLHLGDGSFLQDWWCQFWEIYTGYRQPKTANGQVLSYIGTQRQAQKARTNMMAAGGMDATGIQQMRMNNGMMVPVMDNGVMGMPNDLQRKAMQNRQAMTPQQQHQMQQMMQRQAQAQGNAMERQGSQMDMSGPRSGSPGSGDAPSPKRQRLEGNMQQMNQRPGPPNQMPSNQVGFPTSSHPGTPNMPVPDPAIIAQTEQMLRQRGIDPALIDPLQIQNLARQPANHQAKSVETYSASIQQSMKAALNKQNQGMPQNAMAPMGAGQGSPGGMDAAAEFYAANASNGARASMPPGMGIPGQVNAAAIANAGQAGNNGNHALQDYQMQLMLLEQQNKKRLLMARQEQDSMANPGMPPNGPGQFQGMVGSPGTQRGGDPSPNAGDMRGTPKMNRMSPNDGRGSPQPGMMGPGMGSEQLQRQMLGNVQMMRPPSSHPMGQGMGPGGTPLSQEQMNMMRSQTNLNGNWQQGPGLQMMPGQPGQGPPNPNMARQLPMAPPPPPPAGTGPSSPAQPPAPPTPSQTTKSKPATKKGEGKKGKKGAQNTSATPASEAEAPPTPTPATPMTPMHQNSFNHNQNKGIPNGQQPPNAPQQQPGQPPQNQPNQPQPVQPPPPMMDQPFGNLDSDGFGINMDFANLEGSDVLDNFDFDSFLNTGDGDPGLGFDANLAFGDMGLEAGADLSGGN